MADILISDFKDIDYDNYERFLSKCQASTYFCTSDYLSEFENVYFIGAYQDDLLIGSICLRIRKLMPIFGNFFKAGWMESSILVEMDVTSPEKIRELLLSELTNFAKKQSLVYLYISHWVRSQDYNLLTKFGFELDEKSTIILDLRKGDEALLKEMEYNNRRSIKLANKNNLKIEHYRGKEAIANVRIFNDLREITQKRAVRKNTKTSMTLKSLDHISGIINSKYNLTWLSIVYSNDKIASGGLFVSNNKTVIYYLGGSDRDTANKTFASYFLLFESFKYARSLNFDFFDLGGIPNNPDKTDPGYGVYLFKKRFGGSKREFSGGTLKLRRLSSIIISSFTRQKWLVRLIMKFQNK